MRGDADPTSTTEATPLIRSETSSAASDGPASGRTSSSSEIYRDVEGASGARGGDGDEPPDEPNQKVGPGRALAIVLSVYVLIFLQASNMSGMTMAQSVIAAEFDAYEEASWFISSFLIAVSSCTPLAGRLASIFSPRPMVLVASILFAIGSLVSSQANSFSVFIIGRVIAGVGAASIMVLAVILVLELTTKRGRGVFIGLTNAGFTTGVSLGAVIFGALIASTGWRALFYVQAPISVAGGLGVFFSIPKSFTSGQGADKSRSLGKKLRDIDYIGAIMMTGTIVLFLYGLSENIKTLPLVLSLVGLVSFILFEYKVAADPIVPLAVLGSRGALLSCVAQLGLMVARWTVLFYTPITALAVWGFNPAAAGSVLIPTNLGFGIGGLLVGWLHVKRAGSFYVSCLVSLALFTGSLIALAFATAVNTNFPAYFLAVFVNGIFTGAALNYTLAHVLHLTLPRTHYMTTSLVGTFRGFAGSFGSAIGGGIFARTLRRSLEDGFRAMDGDDDADGRRAALIRKLLGSPALVYGGGLSAREQEVAAQGYAHATRVLFLAAVALSAVVFIVQAGTGWKTPVDDDLVENPASDAACEDEERR